MIEVKENITEEEVAQLLKDIKGRNQQVRVRLRTHYFTASEADIDTYPELTWDALIITKDAAREKRMLIALVNIQGHGKVYEVNNELYEDVVSDRKPVSAIREGTFILDFDDSLADH